MEGRRAFESFNQSISLNRIFRQEGEDSEQVKFQDALLCLRTYSTTQEDYNLFATRCWDNLTAEEKNKYKDVLHLLPTHASVLECNHCQLAALAKPVIKCKAKHDCPAAKKTSEGDAEGLEPEILLAEGAHIMITRNL